MPNLHDYQRAAQIVVDAGGRIVGRTKLQKIAYLLEVTGLGQGFAFAYKHYGPYSEQLTAAARSARLFGLINEVEQPTSWGGSYSIFDTTSLAPPAGDALRREVAGIAVAADPIELELAATAAFLAHEGEPDAWAETARRKPEKATPPRLAAARKLYRKLRSIPTPRPLPAIV